jgi:hypothetical protein
MEALNLVRTKLGSVTRNILMFELNVRREKMYSETARFSHLEYGLPDMGHVAALMQEMDVVVGVDSPEVNVAGALACETRVLLGEHAEWWWGKESEVCGWYRYAKGYRNRTGGSVASSVEQLLTELEGMSVEAVFDHKLS